MLVLLGLKYKINSPCNISIFNNTILFVELINQIVKMIGDYSIFMNANGKFHNNYEAVHDDFETLIDEFEILHGLFNSGRTAV